MAADSSKITLDDVLGGIKRLMPSKLHDALYYLRHREPRDDIKAYIDGGREPWSRGYKEYKSQTIATTLTDRDLMSRFLAAAPLPEGYGFGVDERCVEYPWALARMRTSGLVLDAGSTMNHQFILESELLKGVAIHIATLAPEEYCFWKRPASYLFCDFRDLPLRNALYDGVFCLSTLEHVGFDNAFFARGTAPEHDPNAFVGVVRELRRVLKPNGSLLLTVPFGRYLDRGWFQQFDRDKLEQAIEAFGPAKVVARTFYRYSAQGWQVSDLDGCRDAEYVSWNDPRFNPAIVDEPDRAPAARAVACVELVAG